MTETQTVDVPWTETLTGKRACREAVQFARQFPTFQAAWDACDRSDWMLWWIGRVGGDRRRLVKMACQCARLALVHVRAGEERPLRAIEIAERWASGDESVSLHDVRKAASAASAAYAADAAASAAAYAYAAYAAASAASAAAYAYAAYAADAAASAASAAAYAAAYATYAAARNGILKQCADIVRAEYPMPPEL